ncbi:hypothetical protein WA171_002939 [Blastocystis sp. BT1]
MSVVPKATRYLATVVSAKMQKSCVVVVEKMKWNSHIKKNLPQRTRMIVHDENNAAVIGDKVLIEAAGRRLSKKKTFVIKDIVKKSSFEKEFYDHLNSPNAVKAVQNVLEK